jgi:hypothetical protein
MYNKHISSCPGAAVAVQPMPQTIPNNTDTQNMYIITLNSLSGSEYKYMSRLIQDTTLALNHETNLSKYRIQLGSRIRRDLEPIRDIRNMVISKEECDALCDDDHPLNTEIRGKWELIANKINGLSANGIQILPLLDLRNPITLKIWFNPSLLTDADHESLKGEDDYPKRNRETINSYLSGVIAASIVNIYINENHPRSSCLFSEMSPDIHPDYDISKDMFYKDIHSDRMVLKKLTKEAMMSMMNVDIINTILFCDLNAYHVESKTIDFDYYLVRNVIANALDSLLAKKYANTRTKKNTTPDTEITNDDTERTNEDTTDLTTPDTEITNDETTYQVELTTADTEPSIQHTKVAIRTTGGSKLYKCKLCKFSSKYSSNYKEHLKTKKHCVQAKICYICKKQYIRPNIYNKHIASCTYTQQHTG